MVGSLLGGCWHLSVCPAGNLIPLSPQRGEGLLECGREPDKQGADIKKDSPLPPRDRTNQWEPCPLPSPLLIGCQGIS